MARPAEPHAWSWKAKDGRVIYIWPRRDRYHLVITDQQGGRWESPEPVRITTLIFYLEKFHNASSQLIGMINAHHVEYLKKRKSK